MYLIKYLLPQSSLTSIVANGISTRESIVLASNSSDISFFLDTFSHSLEFIPPLTYHKKKNALFNLFNLYPNLIEFNMSKHLLRNGTTCIEIYCEAT